MRNGHDFIRDKNECIKAAKGLGVEVTENPAPSGNRQKWCGTWDRLKYLHFNTQTSGNMDGRPILQDASVRSKQICERISKYSSILKCYPVFKMKKLTNLDLGIYLYTS